MGDTFPGKLTESFDMETKTQFEAAVTAARRKTNFDLVAWPLVANKSTPREMAKELRLRSHKAMVAMEKIYYNNPVHLVQWIVENEQIALQLEECDSVGAAIAILKEQRKF